MTEDESQEDDGGYGSVLSGVGEAIEQSEKENQEENEQRETEGTLTDAQPSPSTSQGQTEERTQTDTSQPSSNNSQSSSGSREITREDLPHRLKHDSPKDGRQSLNIYIASDDKQRINELYSLAEREYDEKVNQIDVYLAALRADFYNDHSFLDEMEKIGYGF